MLKRINPEDLKEGQECYIKVVTRKNSDGSITMIDEAGYAYFPSRGEPIYTLEEDQPIVATLEQTDPDPELEMLVNVANDIFCASNNPKYTVEDAAVDAYNLIAACKKIKEGER